MIRHWLIADEIAGGDAGERKYSGCECRVTLIEANRVQAVSGRARDFGCGAGQSCERRGKQSCAGDARPNSERLCDYGFNFVQAASRGCVQREDGDWTCAERSAPLAIDA